MALSTKKYTKKELINWMTSFFKSSKNSQPAELNNILNDSTSSVVIGKLYFFWYDPKYKDTLPVYDRFPLVFPIEPYPDGFLGLNIHYLSFEERTSIINKLMSFADDKSMSSNMKLKLSYNLLSNTIGLSSLMRPCIKRYLYNHVRSQFKLVIPSEWDKAAQLGLEVFVTNQRK